MDAFIHHEELPVSDLMSSVQDLCDTAPSGFEVQCPRPKYSLSLHLRIYHISQLGPLTMNDCSCAHLSSFKYAAARFVYPAVSLGLFTTASV